MEELYKYQNNTARIFKLKCEIVAPGQGKNVLAEHIGNLKKNWGKLEMYHPSTIDAKTCSNVIFHVFKPCFDHFYIID